MQVLATHPYYKVQRHVSSTEQKDIEEERELILYKDKICSQYREFPIQKVFDISYRMIGQDVGFLYLHTSKGVYSYKIKSTPKQFIDAYKREINKSSF